MARNARLQNHGGSSLDGCLNPQHQPRAHCGGFSKKKRRAPGKVNGAKKKALRMTHIATRAPRRNLKFSLPDFPAEPLFTGLPYHASAPALDRRPKNAGELIDGHEFFELRDRTLHRSFFQERR